MFSSAAVSSRSSIVILCAFNTRVMVTGSLKDNIRTKFSSFMWVFLRGILKALLVISIDGDSRDELKPKYRDFVYSRIG